MCSRGQVTQYNAGHENAVPDESAFAAHCNHQKTNRQPLLLRVSDQDKEEEKALFRTSAPVIEIGNISARKTSRIMTSSWLNRRKTNNSS